MTPQGFVAKWSKVALRKSMNRCGKLNHWSRKMLQDITTVKPLEGYRLRLEFQDGASGIVDISEIVPFTGVFAPLRDKTYFRQVSVNPDIGTICWPNGADIDPDVLYSLVTGEPIRDFEPLASEAE